MALRKRRKNARIVETAQGIKDLECECGRMEEVSADTRKVTCAYCVQRLLDPPFEKPKPILDEFGNKRKRGRPRKSKIGQESEERWQQRPGDGDMGG